MKTRGRTDVNQQSIVAWVRRHYAGQVSVYSTANLGGGFPDLSLACGPRVGSVTRLLEVKRDAKAKLTADQQRFHALWKGGPLHVIWSEEQVEVILLELERGAG